MAKNLSADDQLVSSTDSNLDQGMKIFSYLLAGIFAYGGLGWIIDYLFGTSWWMLVGIIAGTTLSLYSIIKKFGSAR